jgi:hypothetical protein
MRRRIQLDCVRKQSGRRRRTDEERGMPDARHHTNFRRRRGRAHRYQNDNRNGHADRRHGVHHYAQRAMVGIGLMRVNVNNLNERQQKYQEKTHRHSQRRVARHVRSGLLASAQRSLRSNQDTQVFVNGKSNGARELQQVGRQHV